MRLATTHAHCAYSHPLQNLKQFCWFRLHSLPLPSSPFLASQCLVQQRPLHVHSCHYEPIASEVGENRGVQLRVDGSKYPRDEEDGSVGVWSCGVEDWGGVGREGAQVYTLDSLVYGFASRILLSVRFKMPSSLLRVSVATGSGPGWNGLPLYTYTAETAGQELPQYQRYIASGYCRQRNCYTTNVMRGPVALARAGRR